MPTPPVLDIVAADLDAYLVADAVIDHDHPLVRARAQQLAAGRRDEVDTARASYEFVRDEIAHATDAADPRVTCSASEVLREGVGLCYAKSHLLTALLRAQGIAAGLCYQRFDVLHGLTAVHLTSVGRWIRLDARGNRPGIHARFSIDVEHLAFTVRPEDGEEDLPQVYPTPRPSVVTALRAARPGPGWYLTGLPTAV